MLDFIFYAKQGLFHILDIEGTDHLLFVTLLCARYQLMDWKKVLILLTSFTVGHSISLFFTALGYRFISSDVVEFLIPLTIFTTGVFNLLHQNKEDRLYPSYLIALAFGLIHGMGFSNFFQAMMMGIDDNIIFPLLAFNCGIEVGQLIIVAFFAGLTFLYIKFSRLKEAYWRLGINILGTCIALWWTISNFIA